MSPKSSRRNLLERRLRQADETQQRTAGKLAGAEASSPSSYGGAIVRNHRHAAVVPSFGQEQMWILDQLDPGQSVYNIARLYRLSGPLDVGALERSLREIIRRHETLRTVLRPVDGRPELLVQDATGFSFSVTDLSDRPEADRTKAAGELAHEHARAPFDLARDLFLRPRLFRLAEDNHLLLVNTHHIAWDAWSASVFWSELRALYQAFHSVPQQGWPTQPWGQYSPCQPPSFRFLTGTVGA